MNTERVATKDLTVTNASPGFAIPGAARGVVVVIALVALADWLFYRHVPGISIALFLLSLVAGVTAANLHQVKTGVLPKAAVVFLLSLAPLVIELSLLAVLFGVAGAVYFTLRATQTGAQWFIRLRDVYSLLSRCGWQAIADIVTAFQRWTREGHAATGFGVLVAWLLPVVLGAVFLLLFASANPLIERALSHLDFRSGLSIISVPRIAFWTLMIALSWPFIFLIRRTPILDAVQGLAKSVLSDIGPIPLPDRLFGQAAILRSLILFNILFAVQTGLDGLYLWGGVALPAGMTYASYAHRGAYPLIITALLAAAFVIAAMRPGSATEKSPLIRALVFVWIAQNVLLVGSSIFRLDLYVSVYSLTYWRLAAGIWMALVAVGLVLIVARILFQRSDAWLVRMNAASLALTLYACCFVNFPHLIASYNVAHSEIPGERTYLDLKYLPCLGAQAIPALNSFLDKGGNPSMYPFMQEAVSRRNNLAKAHLARMEDWRGWTLRNHQLAEYLKLHPHRDFGK